MVVPRLQTHLIPGLPVPLFLSLWTNDLQQIDPLDKRSPSNSVPMDKWSPKLWSLWTNGPNQFGPCTSRSPQLVPLDKPNILGTICPGGPNWLGTICPWGTIFLQTISPWGLNWLGTVWPEGPIHWGPIVEDQMSGDHIHLRPNVYSRP